LIIITGFVAFAPQEITVTDPLSQSVKLEALPKKALKAAALALKTIFRIRMAKQTACLVRGLQNQIKLELVVAAVQELSSTKINVRLVLKGIFAMAC